MDQSRHAYGRVPRARETSVVRFPAARTFSGELEHVICADAHGLSSRVPCASDRINLRSCGPAQLRTCVGEPCLSSVLTREECLCPYLCPARWYVASVFLSSSWRQPALSGLGARPATRAAAAPRHAGTTSSIRARCATDRTFCRRRPAGR